MGDMMSLEEHEKDYFPEAWEEYSIQELGEWIHLLVTRSTHRKAVEKVKKDLHDAKNYFEMIEKKLRYMAGVNDLKWEEL